MEITSHRYFTITILTIWSHVTFKWQQVSVVVELVWPDSMAAPQNLPLAAKILKISLAEAEL